MADLVIRNGLVVTPQGVIRGGLSVREGRITQVSPDASLPTGEEVVDAGGNFLLPGLIDPHLHFGSAAVGRGQGEAKFISDFKTETVSAAVGGITTGITTAFFGGAWRSLLRCVRRAKEIGAENSLIDFKISGMITTESHLDEIPQLFEEGVTSFKFLMGYKGEEGRQLGVTGIDWGFAYRGLAIIAGCGPPALAMLHAEQAEIIYTLRESLKAQGRADLAAWAESRPGICEAMDIFAAGLIAWKLGVPLYVVHTSAREGVEAIRYFKEKRARVFGETCAHYLVLNKDAEVGLLGKVNPPLREEADSESLWRGLREGTLDTMGSDHVACQRWQKEEGGIWEIMPGFPCMGATLPLLLTEGVNKGRISIELLVRITSENTARIFGIYPQKGALSPGSDADIVIVDPDKEWRLGQESEKSAADFSLYEGRPVKGKAVKTFVRGKLVAAEGEAVAQPPHGQFITSVHC